jgi:hypothetical protein
LKAAKSMSRGFTPQESRLLGKKNCFLYLALWLVFRFYGAKTKGKRQTNTPLVLITNEPVVYLLMANIIISCGPVDTSVRQR